MKPILQRLTADPENGFGFKEIRGPGFDCLWHDHEKHELILVLESRGFRIVSDDIVPLEGGDLVLVGLCPAEQPWEAGMKSL